MNILAIWNKGNKLISEWQYNLNHHHILSASENIRQYTISILYDKYRLLNLNKLKLFCLITGRTRFVLKYFKLSRMSIKENLTQGYGVGFYKK